MNIEDWEDAESAQLRSKLAQVTQPVSFAEVRVPRIITDTVFFVGRVQRGIRRRIKRS